MKISVRRTDSEGRGENNNASEQEERDREDNLDAIGRWFDHFLTTLLKDLDYIGIARILKKYSRFSHLNPRRWNCHLFTKISLWVFFFVYGLVIPVLTQTYCERLSSHIRRILSIWLRGQTWNFHQLILVLLPDFPLEIWLKSQPLSPDLAEVMTRDTDNTGDIAAANRRVTEKVLCSRDITSRL